MTKGYVFMNANVTDPEKFAAYQPRSMQAIEPYGGKFLVRGGQSEALKGSMRPSSVVLECADYETAKKMVSLRTIRSGASRASGRSRTEHDGGRWPLKPGACAPARC